MTFMSISSRDCLRCLKIQIELKLFLSNSPCVSSNRAYTKWSCRQQSSLTITIARYLRVTCHRPLGLLWSNWKGGYRTFNVRNDFSACCAHAGETGTDESALMLTRKNWKTSLHPVSTGTWTHGSCCHWTTGPARWPLSHGNWRTWSSQVKLLRHILQCN